MKVEYKDGASPGQGFLIFGEDLLPGEPWSIALQRASDKLFLTAREKNPWVGERIFVPLSGEARSDGTLALAVAENVVDNLDQRDQYRITLQGAGGELTGRLQIGQISHSRGPSQNNTASVQEPPVQQPVTPPPHLEPQQAPQPEAAAASAPLQMNQELAARPRRKLWQIAVVLLLALGCLLWYFLAKDKKNEGNTPPATAAQPAPQAVSAPKALSVEEQVRQFFREGTHSPGEALELARNLADKTPAEQDAIYRLWYFAAENGDQNAYLPYGRVLDPSRPQWGTIEKNGYEAFKVYEKAQAAQVKEAEEAAGGLRQYLQDQVAKGDDQARSWLLQIDQPR